MKLFYHIWKFRYVCKHYDVDTVTALNNALVSSRVDCYNSFFVPKIYIQKLQGILNDLANSNHYISAFQLFEQLHWFATRPCIHFKIGLIVYKAFHFDQPTSLINLVSLCTSSFN